MAERQKLAKETGARQEEERPPLTSEQFEATPEFRAFKRAMKKILKVSKSESDNRVRHAKERSPRIGNLNAPGRKPQSL